MLSSLPVYDADVFGPIHSLPTFTSEAENENSIRFILRVIGIITVVNLALVLLMKYLFNAPGKAAWKASYQVTNLLTNATLGLYGIHVHLNLDSNESLENKIHGYPQMKSFALGQMGYQLWAIPVGILCVEETALMLVHHVAVICVASTSAFLTAGFRYYNPYFYGVIEISSVPLSVMNSFKNNKDWIIRYPQAYSLVRFIFSASFLIFRVILWTPFYIDYLVTACMFAYSGGTIVMRSIMSVFIAASLLLTFLQYFWATKIVSAVVKGRPSRPEKKGN
mmetsp:Transcript_37979/g.90909  ORF Transcript_37979/g.90909 Transcript_37979/m.90909 type:complete len:279 (-) Transcript_37979:98-934(-)